MLKNAALLWLALCECNNDAMTVNRLRQFLLLVQCSPALMTAWAQTTPAPAAPPGATPPAAASTPTTPCLFTPDELAPILARKPAAGVAQRDSRGGNVCTYLMPTKDVRHVVVLIDERYTAERFEQRVTLAGRIAASTPILFNKIGDGAFYVAGVAGVRRGLKYVEISGLRQSAARTVTPGDAAALLRLALERLPRF
jgi:hypothetical protein